MTFWCAGLLLLASCGKTPSESELQSSQKAKVGLFVVSGGFTSCNNGSPSGMDLYNKLRELFGQWNTAHSPRPKYLASCFNEKGEVFFKTSDSGHVHHRHTTSEFVESVRDFARGVSGEVWFAGHSHGGWMAMKLVHDIGDDIKVGSLNTVDALSYRRCKPENFAGNGDCQTAPRDFGNHGRDRIRGLTGFWRNDYQRRSYILRSSQIPQAHYNEEHSQSQYSRYTTAAHAALDRKWEIWNDIRERIFL